MWSGIVINPFATCLPDTNSIALKRAKICCAFNFEVSFTPSESEPKGSYMDQAPIHIILKHESFPTKLSRCSMGVVVIDSFAIYSQDANCKKTIAVKRAKICRQCILVSSGKTQYHQNDNFFRKFQYSVKETCVRICLRIFVYLYKYVYLYIETHIHNIC